MAPARSARGSVDVGEVEEADGGRGVAGGALQLQLHLARLRRRSGLQSRRGWLKLDSGAMLALTEKRGEEVCVVCELGEGRLL